MHFFFLLCKVVFKPVLKVELEYFIRYFISPISNRILNYSHLSNIKLKYFTIEGTRRLTAFDAERPFKNN